MNKSFQHKIKRNQCNLCKIQKKINLKHPVHNYQINHITIIQVQIQSIIEAVSNNKFFSRKNKKNMKKKKKRKRKNIKIYQFQKNNHFKINFFNKKLESKALTSHH